MAAAVETLHYPQTPGGYPAAKSDESYAASATAYTHVRPKMIRRESDQILSYYQSDLAGRSDSQPALNDHNEQQPDPLSGLKRTLSASTQCSSSEYSAESLDRHAAEVSTDDSAAQPARHSQHTRRPSVPSQESIDRRRLAIVEVDHSLPPSISRKGSGRSKAHNTQQGVSLPSQLLSRRGIQVNNLALVAPPDASPSTYTDLTPPPTAPLPVSHNYGSLEPGAAAHHNRSASEAVGVWGSPNQRRLRDVGIVGTGTAQDMAAVATSSNAIGQPYRSQTYTDAGGLQVPIFQTPAKSRSPSPAAHALNTPELYANSSTSSLSHSLRITTADARSTEERDQARTPAIGEEKDIQQPVVGPVVVELDSSQVIRRAAFGGISARVANPTSQSSDVSRSDVPYSTAAGSTYSNGPAHTSGALADIGNIPLNGPPPRPPRTMRTPLPGTSPTPPAMEPKHDLDALKEALRLPKSVSVALSARNSPRPESNRSDVSDSKLGDGPAIDTDSSEPHAVAKRSQSVHKREGAFPPSDASATPETSPQIDLSEPDNLMGRISAGPSPRAYTQEPEVIEEDSDRDRGSGWKLHRENSWVSLKSESQRGSSPNGKPAGTLDRRSMSSSPSPLPPPKTGNGTGGDEVWSPSAGSTSASRSPRNSPAHSGTATSRAMLNPGEIAPIPRHVSGGSIASEATFPIRSDAYQATDLSMRPDDDLSSTKTPPSYLPYPSLAAAPSRSATAQPPGMRTYQVPLSIGPSRSGTGFFASIGRKASLKKDRGNGFSLTPSSPSRNVLLKRLPDSHPPTRPIQVNHAPSIPGGPRAVPGRMGRSRTISVVPSAVPTPAPIEYVQEHPKGPVLMRSETHRTSFTSRRASFFHRSTTPAAVQPAVETTSPEFEKQVDKLADLLPHADRKVLAGYLRRAGQDVLAIGQYLEDEKNGNLRYD
ncbi:hypothetical protein EIP86_007046 [Pleurotus ostreatoroseus]|nr:hypothetical protein EIP86_007046 [Pleurotus ostreatoroseus]